MEHRHEWGVIDGWNAGILALCIVEGCDAQLTLEEIERILNDYERLKLALSAEDAKRISGSIFGEWGEDEECLLDYAAILEGDDE